MPNRKSLILASILLTALVPRAHAQEPVTEDEPPSERVEQVERLEPADASRPVERPAAEELSKSFWGWGLGYVFTEIPISQSEFSVFMSKLYYSYYLSHPHESMRTALSLGLYGFALVLPVPEVSADFYLGRPTQDIQGKLGVGAFYDIAVGGHAGVSAELGLRIKNRVDVSFFVVPAGLDATRDYLDFMGLREDNWVDDGGPYVIMPYFGLFVGFHY
jgi:hypothetical protein